MNRHLLFTFLLSLFFDLSFAQGNKVVQTLFFIGDAGEPEIMESGIGRVLRAKSNEPAGEVTVVYLGDNIYPKGLLPRGSARRVHAENILRTQAQWIEGQKARGIIIPGNHDWQKGGRKGLSYILDQAAFVDSLKLGNLQFLPRDGCPGPVEISLGDKAVLVILDTQWILHPWEKPVSEGPCEAKTTSEVMAMVEDIFHKNRNKRVIVAAHHPPITYGEHGGVFTLKDHIFPLTSFSDNLYIPLPGVGSIYPFYRKLIGDVQDTQHPQYKEFSRSIQAIMAKYPGSIFAAGHEHALEYIVRNNTSFVVSGSGVKTSFVRKKGYARFAEDVTGFVQVSVHEQGEVVLSYWKTDQSSPDGKIIFSDTLQTQVRFTENLSPSLPDFSVPTVRVNASDQYKASPTKMKLLGENYRAEWSAKLDVPLFNIGEEQGGLKVLQKGGGMQTLSLRLEDKTGHEFVLRSVEKYPEFAVPEVLRKTFAQDLVQDQISASHPYAALAIPGLAATAGIYHTNPRLVFIPDDYRLGEYRRDFANRLALFEERPAGDWSESAFFGNSKKIINTSKVIEKLQKDNDNQVDQDFVLRSRLFDLWIGDWDRHDDQWRWASFDTKKGESYRPIPRDRDQAFFLNQGKLAKLWSRKWALPKFEGFDQAIDWPAGLSFNARYFDRSFLNGLSKEKWISTARDLEQHLSDSAIERSINAWPAEIRSLHGDRIVRDLKSRKAKLMESAIGLYKFLAREVDVVGSDKPEWFDVERKNDGNVHVMMYKITREGDRGNILYDRLFDESETREIRLFGLGGNDRVDIKGNESKTIIRFIGGDGEDQINDTSDDPRRTFFYDDSRQHSVVHGRVMDKTSTDPEVNRYDRKAFKYNRLAPLLFGNYNPDDGVFIGGGVVSFSQGFRKDPFKSRHLFLATIAPLTSSYNFRYDGRFTEIVGKWDLELDFNLKAPNYVNNFFGLGNETVFDKDVEDQYDLENPISYYRFRFEELLAGAFLSRKIGHSGRFRVGPVYQRIEIEEPSMHARYIDQVYAPTLPYNLYEVFNAYGGMQAQYTIDKRNDPVFTARGVNWTVSAKGLAGLNHETSSFGSVESSLSLYQSFRLPARVVFALRIGGGKNFGGYEFYQAQILDGRTELRGFRKTRFYGDEKLFMNIEMRMKLASFRTYLFPASFGILAFHDGGRVWYSDGLGDPSSPSGKSSVWHTGWGGGLWFTPFNLTVLALEAGHSREGTLGYVRLGFLF